MIFSLADHIEQIKNGTKTQTRRPSGKYQQGKLYAIQPGRGKKGISDGKIIISAKIIELNHPDPKWGWIMADDAKAEGGYTPEEYEKLYNKMYPGWEKRYAYLFRYYTTEELALMETDPNKAFAKAYSRISQQLRINPDPASAADESEKTKSGKTASLPQVEAEKEKKEK